MTTKVYYRFAITTGLFVFSSFASAMESHQVTIHNPGKRLNAATMEYYWQDTDRHALFPLNEAVWDYLSSLDIRDEYVCSVKMARVSVVNSIAIMGVYDVSGCTRVTAKLK